ncbi:Zinc finger protein 19, partial [Operophtera brumata]
SELALRTHTKTHRPESERRFKCSHEGCTKSFNFSHHLKHHELTHTNAKQYYCSFCGKGFIQSHHLKSHLKAHDPAGWLFCEARGCRKRFHTDYARKRHMATHSKITKSHDPAGWLFCEARGCRKRFHTDYARKRHMATHSFIQSHHLKSHLKAHDPAGWLFCEARGCRKRFHTDYARKRHMATHSKITKCYKHDPAGWLFCEARGCRKRFHTDYARKRHMATHKNKPDSGISSDCNSCDASLSSSKDCTEESILCATCGETISQKEYKIHIATCINKKYSDIAAIINEDSDTINEEWPDSPFKPSAFKDHSAPKSIIDRDIGDCSMLLGCSIVNGENCICAQMAKPSSGNYDLTPLVININTVNSANENNINIGTYKNNPTGDLHHGISNSEVDEHKPEIVKVSSATYCNPISQSDMCEGCDCANICSAKVSLYDLTPKIVNRDSAAPNIEYRIDGVIKIIDNFDDDLVVKTKKDDFKTKRFVPFRTCKDVIGNCLVSGGDGCLCARMMADEDQAIMAQEIDDITPQPKTESS